MVRIQYVARFDPDYLLVRVRLVEGIFFYTFLSFLDSPGGIFH